ncbi:MAG: hypothetical protein ABIP59_22505 [Roseateles sp.]
MGRAALALGALQRRILLAGLSEADMRRVEVFLAVNSDRLRQDWRIVAEGPVDVYLHDADELPTIPGSQERAPHQVRVMDERHAEPGSQSILLRPLQYEAFVDILAAVEQQFPAVAPPQAPTTRTTAPLLAATRAAPALTAREAMCFRLRRWPGAGVLDAIHQGLRLASFITVRYLTVDELSSLSGVDRAGCSTFLNTMMEHDLLRAEPAPGARLPARASAKAPASARPDHSLLTSLRAKLGIRREGR